MTAVTAAPAARPVATQFEEVPCNICGSDAYEVIVPSKRDTTKPVDLEKFIVVVRSIDIFWLTIVTLPPNGH